VRELVNGAGEDIKMACVKAWIREFMFCERAWWLEKHNYFGELTASGKDSSVERREAGVEYHQVYSARNPATIANQTVRPFCHAIGFAPRKVLPPASEALG